MSARPQTRETLTAAYARSVLDYDAATGLFHWRYRTDLKEGLARNSWNARMAGKVAGTLKKSDRDSTGHIVIRINRKAYPAHHLAWLMETGEWPDGILDHRNLDGTDNRWDNLRPATLSQNRANVGLTARNTSGFKGIVRSGRKWRARLRVEGEEQNLGSYETPEEAHAVWVEAFTKTHGEFARAA